MPHILLLTLVFAPDGVSTSVLMTELTLELEALARPRDWRCQWGDDGLYW